MDCLNIVGAIISPCPSHPFGFNMIGHDVATVDKFLVTEGAIPFLLDDLSAQQLSHLCRRAEFPISPRVVRIFDALNAKLKSAFFPRLLATAAEE